MLHRRALIHRGLALCAGLASQRLQACEYPMDGFRLVHPWTRATGPEATQAALCMNFEDVTAADRLIEVDTAVASGAEMAGPGALPRVDYPLLPGQRGLLSEGGTHVRLTGLRHPLEVGRAYPMLLGFASGLRLRVDLSIDYPRFS